VQQRNVLISFSIHVLLSDTMHLSLSDQLCTLALFAGIVVVVTKLVFDRWSSASRLGADGKSRKRPPCLPRLPLVGSLPFIVGASELGPHFMAESKRRGDVFAFFAAGQLSRFSCFVETHDGNLAICNVNRMIVFTGAYCIR